VLELNANYTDAKMVVGVDSYVVGSLSWAAKAAASIVGLSGSRQKGSQYLYDAANGGGEASVDATITLSLFLRREQRYQEATQLVGRLVSAYPRNFLVALEYANLLNAAGRGPEAIAAYRKLMAAGQSGLYQDPRLDQAAWGLGEALRGQRDFPSAAQAYEAVGSYSRVAPELLDRANLSAGQMYDVMHQRDRAVNKYKQVIASAGDSPRAGQARKYLKQAYQLPKT
jgi:tetratricopeptide (TPR) repeat protein